MVTDYHLIAQNTNGNWVDLDLGNNKPSINIQIIDISNLENRQATYSQNLILPFTAGNASFFMGADIRDSSSIIPYRRLPCRLYCGTATILGEGSYIDLLRITATGYNVQLLSGIAMFLDLLKDKPMSIVNTDTNKTPFDGWYITQQYMNPAYFDDFWTFGAMTTEKDTSPTSIRSTVGSFMPCAKIIPVIKRIITGNGYTDDITISAPYDYFVAVDPTSAVEEAEDPNASERGSSVTFDSPESTNVINNSLRAIIQNSPPVGTLTTTTYNYFNTKFGQDHNYLMSCIKWTPPGRDAYRVRIEWSDIIKRVSSPYFLCIAVDYESGGSATSAILKRSHVANDTTSSIIFSEDILVPRQYSLYIAVQALFYNGTNGSGSGKNSPWYSQVDIFNFRNLSTSVVTGKFNIASSLGFETQFDCFKAFMQAYGALLYVDEVAKKIYLRPLDILYQNRDSGNYKDWTAYELYNDKDEVNFKIDGYARENFITMQENPSDNITDSASFIVDDTGLEPEKTIIELPFESGKDNIFTLNRISSDEEAEVANIPIYSYDDKGNPKATATSPHIVNIPYMESPYRIPVGSTNYWYSNVRHIKTQQIISDRYSALYAGLLNQAKNVTKKLMLPESEIESFNPFIPVYLGSYGAYFFVAQIRNYVVGELTEVQLIKL